MTSDGPYQKDHVRENAAKRNSCGLLLAVHIERLRR